MLDELTYTAPWGSSLKAMTAITTLLLMAIPIITLIVRSQNPIVFLGAVVTPVLLLVFAALFMIRGYGLTENTLYVHRLLWNTAEDLTTLISVETDSDAMKKSIRKMGNGGLFGFYGKFKNSRLGNYQAYATDASKAVVLKLQDHTVVVTPEKPDEFVQALKNLRQIPDRPESETPHEEPAEQTGP